MNNDNQQTPNITSPTQQPDLGMDTGQQKPATLPESPQVVTNKSKGPKRGGSMLMIILIILLLAAAGAATYFFTANSSLQDDVDALENQVAKLDADTHELPEGAIKVSECVPNMGFHYLAKDGDPRLGPFYLVNKQGAVIGLEYMFNESMMTALDIPAEAIEEVGEEPFPVEVLTSGPEELSDWQFNNIEMSRSPEGHIGFEEPHMDLHLYTVTPEAQAQSCQ